MELSNQNAVALLLDINQDIEECAEATTDLIPEKLKMAKSKKIEFKGAEITI